MTKTADFTQWDCIDPVKLAHAAHLWIGLEPNGNDGPTDSTGYRIFTRLKQDAHDRHLLGSNARYPKGYSRISRDDLKKIAEDWGEKPPFLCPEERVESKIKATIASETRCQDWLAKKMHQRDRPEKAKPEYLSEAQSKFGVSRRGFDRAWKGAI